MSDLISREALKKALKSNCDTLCNDKNTSWCEHCCPLNDFEDLIDNAPTAEDWQKYSDELWKNAYKEGYKQAIRDGKTNFSRPQGEWIRLNERTKNPQLWYKCNLCGANYLPTNFCPNCGADMRGGRE